MCPLFHFRWKLLRITLLFRLIIRSWFYYPVMKLFFLKAQTEFTSFNLLVMFTEYTQHSGVINRFPWETSAWPSWLWSHSFISFKSLSDAIQSCWDGFHLIFWGNIRWLNLLSCTWGYIWMFWVITVKGKKLLHWSATFSQKKLFWF